MADDLNVLEHHLAPRNPNASATTRRYVRMSTGSEGSVMYRPTSRVRPGWQSTPIPGLAQREIMENVLGSRTTDVIRLYFSAVNPWFPIVDEALFWKLWHKDASLISSTLVCDIYAIAFAYWHSSDALRDTARPDMQFAWNQAVLALRDDCMAPSLTTVHAALLEMLGRPVYYATGNIITAGRTISSAEKSLRIRVWWAVLIHDRCLSHGTPPNIASGQYDVPIPELGSFVADGASTRDQRAGAVFHQLCRLTAILGDILPVAYSLQADNQQEFKIIRRVESSLDTWEDALPDFLNLKASRDILRHDDEPSAASLWFYYLTLKLMLKRLAFRTTLRDKSQPQVIAKQYRFTELFDAATTIIEFVASLRSDDLRSFWLPYTTYLLTSATTTLLRCTVESTEIEEKRRSAFTLVRLMRMLCTAREEYDWDLAELCVETCGQSIENVAGAYDAVTLPMTDIPPFTQVALPNTVGHAQPAESDMPNGLDDNFWLDIGSPWAALWAGNVGP
ncbi:hypothetical protein B0A48_01183 [Cryoendolithus antarcticus]|uniref:Xylanolytic transcriptional activator regulatory domain-containing protein n=1 Tax=Cryoendolithus antarcticus TaxID=1507870 RepID=A0A1V8TSL6_9PEZI|nr:hypothetical protein B0A48_01183 [Cryoendolithus antarcticus]